MENLHKNMAVQIQTPGGDNPLTLKLVQQTPLYLGIAASGLSLVAKGGKPPYAFSVLSSSNSDLPPGLSIPDPVDTERAQILGTPTVAGHYTFIAEVSDSNSLTFPHAFSLDIKAPVVWIRFQPQIGEETVAYSYQMIASDLSGTHITSGYSLVNGNLPDGLSINSAGIINGTPTNAAVGFSYATIGVTVGSDTATIPIKIEIRAALTAHFVEDQDPPNGWGGGAGTWLPDIVRMIDWTMHLAIENGVEPYSISENPADPYPAGITANSGNRVVHGKATQAAQVDPWLLGTLITDALGKTITVQRAAFIRTPFSQARIQPRRNGTDVAGGDGAEFLDIVEGSGIAVVAENDGQTMRYTIASTGGGGGGDLSTINHIGPDSSGNIDIVSPDGSVTIGEDSSGRLTLEAVAGGGIYILGVPSNGTQYVAYTFSPTPVGFTPDKWDAPSALGALQTGLTVDPATGDISGTPTVHGTSTAYAVALESTTGKTAWIRYDLTIDAPSGTDPYFANVVLLMHMDGTSGSTTFIDVIGHTLTPAGSAQISTADYVFGGASGLFSTATSDWVDVAASSDFSFGTGDFTIEGWFQVPDTGLHFILGWDSDNGIYAASSQLLFWNGGSNIVGTSGTLLTNTWYYFALTRESGVVTMWLDGTFVQSNPFTTNYANTNFRVGGRTTGSNGMTGYLDDIRVTKGVARYSSNFTRPATPFPDS
jgi:hypothetical protein